jgi:transcriptional regulator with XRE-family HTH domain
MFENKPIQFTSNVARGVAGIAIAFSAVGSNATSLSPLSDSSMNSFSRYQRVSSRPSFYSVNEQINVFGWREYFQIVRSTFSPAVSDLAYAFDVTRQAVYKWLNGSAIPEDAKFAKLQRFFDVANAFNVMGVTAKADYLKLKVFQGRSLLDLIRENGLSDAQINQFVTEIKSMQTEFKVATRNPSKANPTDDWRSDQSISHSFL